MPDPPDRLAAALQDRYTLQHEVGRGGMATVYLATDRKHERAVALKVLKPELAAVLGSDRFLREIKTTAQLMHPHILPLLDSGEADGTLFYVMPYVEGESLRDRLAREKQLPVEDALQISREVADALSYAHSRGVIHRDIKPENILLQSGHAVVADFGIARAIDQAGGDRLTETGVTLGTPTYMSPEQAGGSQDLDGRSDLYSLGCVLFEMLAGQPPFTGPTLESVVHQHLAAAPPNVTNIRPAVPSWVVTVLERTLAKTPADRFHPVAQFTAAIAPRGSLAEAAVPAPPSASARKRWVGWAAGVALLALVGVATWNHFRDSAAVGSAPQDGSGSEATAEAMARNRVAVFPFAYQGSEQYAEFRDGITYLLAAALDGAGELTVVDPNALLPAAQRDDGGAIDVEGAQRIATTFHAGRFVLGQIAVTGANLRLTGWLYEGGAPVTHASVNGAPEAFAALVDALAAQLAVSVLGDGGASLVGTAAKSTESFEALKAYLEGEAEFRSGKPRAARDAFGRAVELDSTFALAWYRLALAAGWVGEPDLRRHAADEAVRHAARLGFREREILNGSSAEGRGAFDESERHYTAVLARYPDDVEAWYGLGVLYYHYAFLHGRPFSSARAPLERAQAYSAKDTRALQLLILEAYQSGDWERSDSLLQVFNQVVGNASDFMPATDRLARALRRGTQQEQEAARAAVLVEATRGSDRGLTGDIQGTGLLGEFDLARQVASLLAHREASDWRAWGRLMAASTALAGGRWQAAQAELDTLATLQPAWSLEYRALWTTAPFLSASRTDLQTLREQLTRWDAAAVPPIPHRHSYLNAHNGVHQHLRLYLLGVVSARLGDYGAAASFAAALERLDAPNAGSLSTDLAQSIGAHTAWSRGANEEVLDALERMRIAVPWERAWASPFFGRSMERYQRARALQQAGRLREAAIVYETHGKLWPDLVFRAPAELGLAEIAEALGDTVGATRRYGQFVRLWRDCDPELRPIVEQAERRLAALSPDR